MKVQEELICPHCGKATRKCLRNVADAASFSVVQKSCCFWCGMELPEDEKTESAGNTAADRLAALLGEGGSVDSPVIVPEESDRRFCCNCRHCARHAFVNRCLLTMQEVDPMSECPQFEIRPDL